ncbi:MAG TPA: RHS repeat-associated core domain-containing protein [Pyrinomonadaceae bacterium]|jgi:RHS repeat-associated protein|nr:RHS repeat-associated core domain-containing protein [Pyrinomonadaceae bacterium]
MKRTLTSNSLIFIFFVCVLAFSSPVNGQSDQSNIQYTQGQVNENATLSFGIPLSSYPGRGISLPVGLSYSSTVWRIEHFATVKTPNISGVKQSVTRTLYGEHSKSGWKSSLDVPQIEWPKEDERYDYKGRPSTSYNYRIAKVTIYMPDGSSHEFRKSDTFYIGGIDTGGPFYAVDSSRMRYESVDADTGTLFLPDGTRYILDAGSCQLIDRLGNTLTYTASTHQWTDTLGRPIGNPLPDNPTPGNYFYNLPGWSEVNGGLQTYILVWKNLAEALTPDANNQTPELRYMASHYLPDPNSLPTNADQSNYPRLQSADHQSLFQSAFLPDGDPPNPNPVPTLVIGPGQPEGQLFNPVVLAEVVLPGGSSYKFSYNVYGELDHVVYPTGAFDKYVYEPMLSYQDGFHEPYVQANRKISSRIQSLNGFGNDILEWKYLQTQLNSGHRKMLIVAPDKTRTEVFKYEFPEPGDITGKQYWPFGIADAKNGLVFEKRSYSTSADGFGGQILRRELTKYEDSVYTYTYTAQGINPPFTKTVTAGRNGRPVKVTSILFEGNGPALAQSSSFSYDATNQFTTGLDRTVSYVYNFAVVNNNSETDIAQAGSIDVIPMGSLAKYTEITYKNDTAYQSVNILGLPAVIKERIGPADSDIISQNEIVYDECPDYCSEGSIAMPTSKRIWDSSKGPVTTSNAYLITHTKFNQYGNPIENIDAKGNVTTTVYDATNTYQVSVTSPAPDSSGGTYGSASGFTTYTTYDPISGLMLSTTDANNQTTWMRYDDPLLRLTKVTAPNGHQTVTEYGHPDLNGILQESQRFVKVRTQIDAVNWSENSSWFDGAGRTIKSQKVDADGDVFGVTIYDQMGRVKETSNPFRNISNPNCATNLRCVKNFYDDLGRPVQLTTPDPTATSTTMQVSYGLSIAGIIGTTKTVIDPAGKKRTSIIDALGNTIRVIEDPDGQNLSTDYVFDKLGNVHKVTQGGQTRYFRYDSLGRVLYARQVEQDANSNFSGPAYADTITGNNQWSVKYQYDDNGNLISSTDARNNSITTTFDRLDRATLKNYSDPGMPDIAFYYDGAGLGSIPNYSKGKTTRIVSSVSESRYTSFDNVGRLLTSEQRTTAEQLAGTQAPYTFSYVYNLSGALVEETYPSGRVIKSTFNQDGELIRLQGKKNNTSGYWTYADNFTYNSSSAVTKMQFGNGHWETAVYNDRQQVTMIGLGTTDSIENPNLLKLEFEYTTANAHDNNGSLKKQKITVPSVGANSGFVATQSYAYDGLNRIQSAIETVAGVGQTWKQTFLYDRYGNRTFDTSSNNTTTLGNCPQIVCNPTVSPANNHFSSGQYYSYDATGNIISDPTSRAFLYDSENRQNEIRSAPGTQGATLGLYFYDASGNRVKKITPDEITIFVYDAFGNLAVEYSTKTATTPQVNYLTADHLGSVRMTTGASGGTISRKDFSAFGEEIVTSQRTQGLGYAAAEENEVRQDYTGYQKDDESGLQYAQARYYNTQHGRFTSVDPLAASARLYMPQSWNRYAYARNNPLTIIDPSGMFEFAPGVTTDERDRIVSAYNNVLRLLETLTVGSKQYNAVKRSLDALGAPNTANGVIVTVGAQTGGEDTTAGTTGSLSIDNNGNVTGAGVLVTINLDKFAESTGGNQKLERALGHEGTHAADMQVAANSVKGMAYEDAKKAIAGNPKFCRALSEVRAERVDNYLARAQGVATPLLTGPERSVLYDPQWGGQDGDAQLDANIKKHVTNPSGVYKFQYSQKGASLKVPLLNNGLDNPANWSNNGGPILKQ